MCCTYVKILLDLSYIAYNRKDLGISFHSPGRRENDHALDVEDEEEDLPVADRLGDHT